MSFETALRYVLQNEVPCDSKGNPRPDRAFENDPHDPGGMTTWGIIVSEYAAWLHKPESWIKTPDAKKTMIEMTLEEAAAVYHAKYWNLMRCDAITNPAIATAMMDAAVNPGQGFATRAVQIISSALVDGRIGPETITKINKTAPKYFIQTLRDRAREYYDERAHQNGSLNRYLLGWHNRADRLLTLIPKA